MHTFNKSTLGVFKMKILQSIVFMKLEINKNSLTLNAFIVHQVKAKPIKWIFLSIENTKSINTLI